MSIRLYVGNLPREDVERQELQATFGEEIEGLSVKIMKDPKTGKCRGFAFVTVPTDELADRLIEKCNGQTFMDSPLKIERAKPRSSKSEDATDGDSAETSTVAAPKKRSSKKPRGGQGKGGAKVVTEAGPVQPDPRWAGELAKLKEMLAAQTTNS
ncbi:RNA-binding protein (RRM domain) [Rubidibacter lacunae KORDI 51-2]|uniref:RNA-binding protein (RRM domain) n=1 Tax=Rubidibacter lacunae KORDI 51-2 TaxID=582515 RepID=U5DS93_9CHRO|nr:RNA-binding protein [Rubidibacter lacunae]ERN42545.1 RNA-binding protein (RRM domain) [Rubidibacter lacunae KORDI 51-2]